MKEVEADCDESIATSSATTTAEDDRPRGDPSHFSRSQLLQQAITEARAQKRKHIRASSPRAADTSTSMEGSRDADRIRAHPLFPVLELFVQKIEDATWNMNPAAFEMDDVVELFGDLERRGVTVQTGDEEVDEVVVASLVALRTHLAELSKVSTLCKSFKSNYIQALKRRMTQDAIVSLGGDSDDDPMTPGTPDSGGGPSNNANNALANGATMATLSTVNGTVTIPLHINSSPVASTSKPTTPHHNENRPKNRPVFDFTSIENSTRTTDEKTTNDEQRNGDKYKGGNPLPRKAEEVLRRWFHANHMNPNPTDAQRAELVKQTGLQLAQVNNWFINARRRILRPLSPSTAAAGDEESLEESDGEPASSS